MKKNRLLWITAWGIMLSILAAFTWWMFALLNYGRIEMELRRQSMADESRVLQNSLVEHVLRGVFDTGQVTVFKHGKGTYRANIPMMEEMVVKRSRGRLELVITDALLLEHRLNVEVSQKAIDEVYNRYERRKTMFVMEGIILSIVVMVSFAWLMFRFSSIVTFNQQQNNFLLAITHELKTPVAAIKLALQTLNRSGLPEEKKLELSSTALKNADRLDELMSNVLLATRIDGKAYTFQKNPVDLCELLEKVKKQALLIGCTIDVQLEMEKDLYVIGDNASLSLAFHNLLNNAVKYASEESPMVSIRAKRNGNDISVEVSDNGRGIADDEKKKIFQKFYRVGDESVRSSKGTGLGLYLVRKILHWHNADIWVEDNKPRGSVFRIVFRL